jgi:hypothetical protein
MSTTLRSLVFAAALAVLAASVLPAAETGIAEPADPEIVLPPIVLEIEDLSVERVEAKLPPEEELLPPAREAPLVDVGDLVIADPSVPTSPGAAGSSTTGTRDRFVAAEVSLGAGTLNHVVGSVALKTLGGVPRFAVDFAHEALDGRGANPLATGYGRRTDELSGSLSLTAGAFDLGLSGSFEEAEHGFQDQSLLFLNRLSRSLDAEATASARAGEWLTIAAVLAAGSDSITLEGSGALRQESEYRLAPSLTLDARFKKVRFGLSARYTLRSSTSGGASELHRFATVLAFGADLTSSLLLDGSVGWFGSSAGANLVPFEIRLTGTPLPFLTLALGGGFRATPQDMGDVLALHPFVDPALPADDSAWFADGSLRLTFTKDLSASVRAEVSSSSALLDAGPASDAATGLFPLEQRRGTRVSTDVGMRWGITQEISLSASLAHEWLPIAILVPGDRLLVELAGLQAAGRWGGNLSVDFTVPQPQAGGLQLPVVSASGFLAVSDVVTLQLGAADVLAPLLPGAIRIDIGAYSAPGFRLTGSVRMSF